MKDCDLEKIPANSNLDRFKLRDRTRCLEKDALGRAKLVLNPLVPRVQKIKIRDLTLNRLLIIEFVKKTIYHGAHYSVSG